MSYFIMKLISRVLNLYTFQYYRFHKVQIHEVTSGRNVDQTSYFGITLSRKPLIQKMYKLKLLFGVIESTNVPVSHFIKV